MKSFSFPGYSFTVRLGCALVLLILAGVAQSAPVVSGNTITWPDDGWYQVQSADDFRSLCEGGASCNVDPGTYIVINHTTGERFERVTVMREESGVVVSGNLISLLDDGWYQVQRASDYSTLCNGTASCRVEAGTYNVINHTTGQRFPNILVTDDTSTEITVAGNVISWPDNGWYQVQRATDFESLCSGTTSCVVDPGQYIVINHTLGQRFEGITVSADELAEKVIRLDNWEAVLTEVVALINANAIDGIEREASILGGLLAGFSGPDDSVEGLPVVFSEETFTDGRNLRMFTCSAGGTILALQFDGAVVRPLDITASECQLNQGTLTGAFEFASQGREGSGTSLFDAYSLTDYDGNGYQLSGTRQTTADRIQFAYSRSWRDTSMVSNDTTGDTVVSNFNVSSSKRTGSSNSLTYYVIQSDGSRVAANRVESNASLSGSFDVTAPWSANQPLSVSVQMQYDGDYVRGGGEFNNTGETVLAPLSLQSDNTFPLVMTPSTPLSIANWNRGELVIEAIDGSALRLSPDTGDFSTFSVSLDGLDTVFTQPWSDSVQLHCEGPFEGCAR